MFHARKLVTSQNRIGSMVWFACAAAMTFSAFVHAAPVTLHNGVSGNGSLRVRVDDYGTIADAFTGGPALIDLFNPSADPVEGELVEEFPTFASYILYFVDPSTTGQGTHRGVATSHQGLLALYNNGNLQCSVVTPNTTNQLPTSTSSVFRCMGAGVDITVNLMQSVATLPPGPHGESAAILNQTYQMRNTAAGPVDLITVKHLDFDMPWGGGPNFALDDLVGADFAALGRAQVFGQDRELITAALNLRTCVDMLLDPLTIDFIYYVGKQTIQPPGNPQYPGGACPPSDYGTDTEVWDNYGAPNCWKNFVPGVGYNVPGISPQISGDAFMGLQAEGHIAPGATFTVPFCTVYGFRPPPTTQIPPTFESQTIQYNQATGCGEFLWSLTNVNPIVPGQDPVDITQFYIDVEAGSGGDQPCLLMIPPPGWSVQLCATDAPNGHRMYKFTGGAPIPRFAEVKGRLVIDTNGIITVNNPFTGENVPPFSVVLHAAQQQEDAACDFTFGPSTTGDWSQRLVATAHIPVPSMSWWSKAVLTGVVALCGFGILRGAQSRRPTS